MTSKFTREELLNIIETDHVQCGEASALARMALAAMDSSESIELPLDYLKGHKDGLEWAAQLAEANHPETGDWLYDDPIELAKAIRKGPDMPPAQPVADSEPVAWTWQHLKQWYVTNDEERARELAWDGVKVEQLYRHAQPAPVVPTFDEWLEIRGSKPLGWIKDAMRESYDACRAAMLQAGTLTNEGETILHNYRTAMEGIGHIRRTLEETFGGLHGTHVEPDVLIECKTICDAIYAAYRGSAQGVPEGCVMVPKEPTAKMYDAGDQQMTTKQVWDAMLAAAPQPQNEPQNIPEIIPQWIPVSERLPEKNGTYQVWNGKHVGAEPFLFGSFQCLNPEQVTHWMPTAKPPREVNHG